MRLSTIAFLILVSACSSSPDGTMTAAGDSAERPIAFVGATVVPVSSPGSLPDHTVIVRGDRIVSVTPAANAEIPSHALRIDARGKYLAPGLAEMHGHIPPPSAPAEQIEDTLFLYAANGITTVRGMLGAEGQLELRERARRREIVSPTLYLAGPSFNGNSISSPEQAASKVRQQKDEGWDLLKVHPGLTRDEFDAMAGTAREVGIRFGGHVPSEVGLLHALEMGQETFDHLDGYLEYLDAYEGAIDQAKMEEAVRRTRESGAWVVPTMALWETILGAADFEAQVRYPELKYVPGPAVESWRRAHANRLENPPLPVELARNAVRNRLTLLGALHRGGVPVLMGTDAPQQFSVPGFSLHRELPHMAAAGMSPADILRSGTVNVGRYFSDQDRFGAVESGHRADLLLLSADPLADSANLSRIEGVMVRGQWLPKSEIDRRLAEIAARYAAE